MATTTATTTTLPPSSSAAGSRQVSYRYWGEFEDDITKLPEKYEAKVTEDNRVYFVNHTLEETQWRNPLNGYCYKVMPGMPYGWQKFKDSDERLVYVDHLSQTRLFVDPRLLSKAVYDFPKKYGIKPHSSVQNFFRPLVRSTEILKEVDLEGRVAVITGANSGLGFQTALCLAERGALVILACRNAGRAEQATSKIRSLHPGAKVEFMHLDLASLSSIKAFAEEFVKRDIPLHVLVCNAGVFLQNYSTTQDGFEMHFGVNHLGHFYLSQLLLPVLLRSKPSRVVVITSESHWYPGDKSSQLDLQSLHRPKSSSARYRAITAYGASKLCNLLFALEFGRRHVESGVSCNAVHPGNLLPTGLSRGAGLGYRLAFTLARPFTKSVDQAASTIVYCAGHPTMKRISGLYMYECWPTEPSPEAQDPHTASALWQLSERLIAERTAALDGQSSMDFS